MLEAKKSKWFEKLFSFYNSNLLNRRFFLLKVNGLDILRAKPPKVPQIIFVNHSSWWDGIVCYRISTLLKLNSFIMMEEKQLKKLLLFRKLGAFSVVRENPREALESVNYAARLLKQDSERTLWIYPQGQILPNHIRPVRFFHGLSKIIKKTDICRVVPMAIRYEFLGNYKPEIFVKVGEPRLLSDVKPNLVKNLTASFETSMSSLLDELNKNILTNNFNDFDQII